MLRVADLAVVLLGRWEYETTLAFRLDRRAAGLKQVAVWTGADLLLGCFY